MRKPTFQIGIVVFTVVLVIFLAITAPKNSSTQPTVVVPTNPARSQPVGTAAPNVISLSAAYDLYMSGSAYILDVRERAEWDEFHIPSTTLLPLGQVAALADKFPTDRVIIVVSAADNRSQQARDILRQAGLTNVSSLSGGIISWRDQGYPIEP